MGVPYLRGVAVAASIAVLVVMAASVTLLPALLAFAGRRVDRLRIPGLGRATFTATTRPRHAGPGGAAPTLAALIAGSAILLVLPRPCSTCAWASRMPATTARHPPARPMSDRPRLRPRRQRPAAARVEPPEPLAGAKSIRGRGRAFVSEPQRDARDGRARADGVPHDRAPGRAPRTCAQAARDELAGTASTSGRRRHRRVPRPERAGGRPAAAVHRGRGQAVFLLLLPAFRSPLIALKAGVMNLLSVAAAYGVIASWRREAGRRPTRSGPRRRRWCRRP